jgi:hypothetical protein
MVSPLAARLIIEKVLAKKKSEKKEPPKPADRFSIFGAHENYHKKHNVDVTAIQAKRLGLKYLGFGRYGMIDPMTQEYTVTHKVINGRLEQVAEGAVDDEFDHKQRGSKWLSNTDQTPLYLQHLDSREIGRINTLFKDQTKGGALAKHRLSKCGDSLKTYCDLEYSRVNKFLSSGSDIEDANEKIQKIIKDLDKLTKHEVSKLDADVHLFRGATGVFEKGTEYSFPWFLSTSADPNTALNFVPSEPRQAKGKPTEYPVMLEIVAKKGQQALNTRAIAKALGHEVQPHEYEFILPRNGTLKIVDGPIRTARNIIIWKAEITDQGMGDGEDLNTRNVIVPAPTGNNP